jgi:hypothetical protein
MREKNTYKLLVESYRERIIRKRRRRWVDNIEMDFGGTGWGDMDWIDLAQDTGSVEGSVNEQMDLQVP